MEEKEGIAHTVRTMPFSELERRLGRLIEKVEVVAKFPDENKKNLYTKVCFLLSSLKRMRLWEVEPYLDRPEVRTMITAEKLRDLKSVLQFLEAALPRLQKKYVNGT